MANDVADSGESAIRDTVRQYVASEFLYGEDEGMLDDSSSRGTPPALDMIAETVRKKRS